MTEAKVDTLENGQKQEAGAAADETEGTADVVDGDSVYCNRESSALTMDEIPAFADMPYAVSMIMNRIFRRAIIPKHRMNIMATWMNWADARRQSRTSGKI